MAFNKLIQEIKDKIEGVSIFGDENRIKYTFDRNPDKESKIKNIHKKHRKNDIMEIRNTQETGREITSLYFTKNKMGSILFFNVIIIISIIVLVIIYVYSKKK